MHILFHFAYLDPGTGSLIIQSLIGAVAGIAVFGRRLLLAVKMKFTGKKADTNTSSKPAAAQTTGSDDATK